MKETIIILLLLGSLSRQASAQLPIPLDSTIHIRITGRDTVLLAAYNLYNFDYLFNGDTISADLLVLKPDDNFSHKSYILAKLQRMDEFIFTPANGKHKAVVFPTGNGIEITNKKAQSTKAYLNFDPELPDPVFLLKQVVDGK